MSGFWVKAVYRSKEFLCFVQKDQNAYGND